MTAGYNCTRDNFFDTVETWIAKGKDANYEAEDKTLKIRNKFVSSDLKNILKQVNMTSEKSKEKRKKRINKSQKIF